MAAQTIWDTVERTRLDIMHENPSHAALVAEKWPMCALAKDWAFQKHGDGSPSLFEMYVTVHLVASIEGGLVAVVGCKFGHTPSPDRDEAENQAKLDQLPHPFYAEFDRRMVVGMLDCDGVFGWECPVEADMNGETIIVPPMTLPLEVGLMPAGKMVYGIHQERGPGLARWCYGWDSIVAFLPKRQLDRLN